MSVSLGHASSYGGPGGETFGSAGAPLSRFANPIWFRPPFGDGERDYNLHSKEATMADSRIRTPGANSRADHTQSEIEAAERLLGDALYLNTDAVFLAILETVQAVAQVRDPDRADKIDAVIMATARTMVHASALAVGRNVNLVRKGGHHG